MSWPMRFPDAVVERQQIALANLAKVGGVELDQQQLAEAVRCCNRQLVICMIAGLQDAATALAEQPIIANNKGSAT